jgi:type I restriction enzyme R subunit
METPSFKEDHISQIPALQLLQNMGYTYLTPKEVDEQRGNKKSNVLLEGILEAQLRKQNNIEFRGQSYKFSNANISKAVLALKDFSLKDGLVITNEKVYDTLSLGKSFEENIQGDIKSFTLHYIDWKNWGNNVFHVAEEMEIERVVKVKPYIPDIVLFVNGIPFGVIECKRPDLIATDGRKPVEQAISQHLRNQLIEDGIPQLFIYSQILLSLATNDARYATVGSNAEFWSSWKEQFATSDEKEEYNRNLYAFKNRPLSNEFKTKLFSERYNYVRQYFDELEKQPVEITEQDQLLYSICRPERLIELVYKFIVYDAGVKKLPRYQQYFGVKKTLQRVKTIEDGKRNGGVIWHTQGSGKSLTMVMLGKCLSIEPGIQNPKIILVTDRIDLDDQIYKTFHNCGKEVTQAKTGKHLVELLSDSKDQIITTVINKFEAAVKAGVDNIPQRDIFILVDESHRSQYGRANVNMRTIIKMGCYIGFTGTPLMKKEKNTANKFGGIIDKYTIDQAVQDKAVVPLLYEGRQVVQNVNQKPIDTFFDFVSEPLTEYQKADLKRKFAKAEPLNEADQRIHRCAWDISLHYNRNWRGTGFKGQLACNSKVAAIKYKEYFDEIGLVTSDVIISPPDTREGTDSIYKEPDDRVLKFWKIKMQQFPNEKEYNTQIINGFKNGDDPEIVIVVDKLLTGFDAPRNTILYLDKQLKEHSLLQAIARVNRVFEGKDFGYIIDYYGNLGNLDNALSTYSGMEEFDDEDLLGTLTNVKEEVGKLAERHTQLWDIFKGISNKLDLEAYERLLRPKNIRDKFYERLSVFVRTLKIALSTVEYIEKTEKETIERYTEDARFFLKLRVSVKSRYSDGIDYRQYEAQIQKLINTHVTSDEVIQLTNQVNIFDKDAFEKEVEQHSSPAARADLIASRTAKTINEKMGEDPAFYKKFSKMLEEVIEQYSHRRLTDAEFLKSVTDIMESVRDKKDVDTPTELVNNENAQAFYRQSKEILKEFATKKLAQVPVELGLNIENIIKRNIVIDWKVKQDTINKMKQEIDDMIYELQDKYDIQIETKQLNELIDKSIEIAKNRYE